MHHSLKFFAVILAIAVFASGCGGTAQVNSAAGTKTEGREKNLSTEQTKTVQAAEETEAGKAIAAVQTNNQIYSTRKIENGTKVNLIVGDTVIPATLNDSKSAKELISRLPVTQEMSHFTHDYCGVMKEPLSYDKSDVHNGWMNGDIDFATDGNYFTILYKDEDSSNQFGYQVNMGVIDAPLSVMDTLDSHISMRIELADTGNQQGQTAQTKTMNFTGAETKTGRTETKVQTKDVIKAVINGKTFTIKLNDSDAAKAFQSRLPMQADMKELNGREKYYNFDPSLTDAAGEKPDQIHAGELMLWQGNCLVVFYNTFSNSYGGYERLGQADDPEGLAEAVGSGDITVTFTK